MTFTMYKNEAKRQLMLREMVDLEHWRQVIHLSHDEINNLKKRIQAMWSHNMLTSKIIWRNKQQQKLCEVICEFESD